jgi:Bacterial membrane protein YfhO
MSERKKDLLYLAALLVLLILFFSKILFTDMIIRAPDIINEFYWGVLDNWQTSLAKLLDFGQIKAGWNTEINSGTTTLGGNSSLHFLVWLKLLFHLIPPPASVAWFIVLHLFFGAAGVYCYCRTIELSRFAAFFAAAVFALAPENASLINAGHVMKIATIAYAPWAFCCLERGFRSRRSFWFLATGFVLAFQFFNSHWQIAYYTCLCVGAYAMIRIVAVLRSAEERRLFPVPRLLGMNLVVMFFFLSTVAISLIPLADWSRDTNRGVQSGANQGKGGLDRDEAMSWSLPPEELAGFVIPGFFGLSRQEAGENPPNIRTYYWGRMVFTQTVSYMGLLPWLLVPLPLIFRRDRYTWLAVVAVAGGVLFSMGKYTPFYNMLYDYFPGINRFRVPKMMMFIPVAGLGLLAAMGVDLLRDEKIRGTGLFRRYLAGIAAVPVALLLLLGLEMGGREYWTAKFYGLLSQPTRYEQGPQLVVQRWQNLVYETGLAAALASLCVGAISLGRRQRWVRWLPTLFLLLYLGDVWRIDDKFMFLVKAPEQSRKVKTPLIEFLGRTPKEFRVLPMDGTDPMRYVSNGIPVMFTSNAVQQRRWQEFLDAFAFNSAMPDILNVKYLVYGTAQYVQEKAQLGGKFQPVFPSPDGAQVVLENRNVLPKGWLVPAVVQVNDPRQTLSVLQNPSFDPRKVAIVESPPPFPMADPDKAQPLPLQDVTVTTYEGERIVATAKAPQNALMVLGEKYYRGWKAAVDGKRTEIYPVDHILRGVYLPPGSHTVEFVFDPLPFKAGKWLTLASFAFFAGMLGREVWVRRRVNSER